MKLPLYKQAKSSFKTIKDSNTNKDINLGLYYQKFCNTWNDNFDDLDKNGFIDSVKYKTKKRSNLLVDESIDRMCCLVYNLGGRFKIYELEERLITGIGLDHPVEVGFLWDHRIGIPYIPGSSIKGLVRNWVEVWEEVEKHNIKRIFGSSDAEKENKVGSVIFFDALPYGAIKLQTDVITPHYGPYYGEGKCPGDWYNPTPIPFLTVDKNQSFIFFVAPRSKENVKDCKQVVKWLDNVITTLGAGAKTATGYGRFVSSEREEKAFDEKLRSKIEEKERKRKLKNMSPIRREMEKDGYSEDKDIFMESLTVKWLERLKEDRKQEEKREIATYLANWYKINKPKHWKNPKGKNIKKVKLIKSFLD